MFHLIMATSNFETVTVCINLNQWNEIDVLSYDVASGSEITQCNKIDKPQVVYRFWGKRYDVHNHVQNIMTKL